jgi:GDP/UDP-N,N'-diacetylbacillosamine 2-epimerase (hydrolysing)
LQALAHVVDELRPDWLLVPADREESMTLALCGTYKNIATAHYAAGDRVVGNADDMIRHAVSRLSHLLLTTHEQARERLIKAGEEEWRVHNVGHAGIDRLRTTEQLSTSELAHALGVENIDDQFAMIIQHPLTSEIAAAGEQMRATLSAVLELGLQAFVSYPNSDPGSNQIINVIEEHRQNPRVSVFKNIPDPEFVNLLRRATVLLGNSSLGLLEAPYLKLPVVNVGRRQSERHHASNVFFVPADREAIVRQVRAIMDNGIGECENPFGDGHTGERVAELLATTPIDARLLNKDLSY